MSNPVFIYLNVAPECERKVVFDNEVTFLHIKSFLDNAGGDQNVQISLTELIQHVFKSSSRFRIALLNNLLYPGSQSVADTMDPKN